MFVSQINIVHALVHYINRLAPCFSSKDAKNKKNLEDRAEKKKLADEARAAGLQATLNVGVVCSVFGLIVDVANCRPWKYW
jgi:hypothetical protein